MKILFDSRPKGLINLKMDQKFRISCGPDPEVHAHSDEPIFLITIVPKFHSHATYSEWPREKYNMTGETGKKNTGTRRIDDKINTPMLMLI